MHISVARPMSCKLIHSRGPDCETLSLATPQAPDEIRPLVGFKRLLAGSPHNKAGDNAGSMAIVPWLQSCGILYDLDFR